MNRTEEFGTAYVSGNLGEFRSYPTTLQVQNNGDCLEYDPRYRPWYVTATTGAKHVLIAIDNSGSMSGTPISLAREAGKEIIDTLSNNDYVGVIKYSTYANYVYSDKIIRATTAVKDAMKT